MTTKKKKCSYRNNQTELYSIVAAYRAAYTEYQPQDAKKQAEAMLTKLKNDYILCMFCFMVCFVVVSCILLLYFISKKSSDKLT